MGLCLVIDVFDVFDAFDVFDVFEVFEVLEVPEMFACARQSKLTASNIVHIKHLVRAD